MQKQTFLQSYFNLLDILIADLNANLEVQATFAPPKFLDMMLDVDLSERDMHGLSREERLKQAGINDAKDMVKRKAADVEDRQ